MSVQYLQATDEIPLNPARYEIAGLSAVPVSRIRLRRSQPVRSQTPGIQTSYLYQSCVDYMLGSKGSTPNLYSSIGMSIASEPKCTLPGNVL